MVHRLALTIGGLGAIGVLGLALVVGGNPLAASSSAATAQPGVEALVDDQLVASLTGNSGVRTVVDTVYVRPDGRRNGSNPQATSSPDPTAPPEATPSPEATASPEPTSSPDPSFAAFDDHGGDRDGDSDDDRSGHRDGDDDFDDDRSGHGDGDDDHDDDRSVHRHGDDDNDDDWDDD
jgi:hypothetical protein